MFTTFDARGLFALKIYTWYIVEEENTFSCNMEIERIRKAKKRRKLSNSLILPPATEKMRRCFPLGNLPPLE